MITAECDVGQLLKTPHLEIRILTNYFAIFSFNVYTYQNGMYQAITQKISYNSRMWE